MKTTLKRRTFIAPLVLAGVARWISPWAGAAEVETKPHAPETGDFSTAATEALRAMTQRADELRVKGVAVVAYIEGETVTSWSSKMAVVGSMKNVPTEKDRGANLLGIAYAKAAEMADSLKDSGAAGRPPAAPA